MAANTLIDETIPADRADAHAGVAVSQAADKLTDGTRHSSRLTLARMVSTRQSNANTPVVCLPTHYVLGQRRMERAIDVTGRSVDPATVSDIVQTVRVLLCRKAGS
jgi:hypothetical protein